MSDTRAVPAQRLLTQGEIEGTPDGFVNVPLWVLIAAETRSYGQTRYDLRHEVEHEG